ncbi:MAG: hypothetical protein ACFFB3_22675 [Candidatus Hodarchaeota archaeon]
MAGTFRILLDTADLVGLQKETTALSAETIVIEIRGILLDIVLPVGLPKEGIVLNVEKFCDSIDRIGRILAPLLGKTTMRLFNSSLTNYTQITWYLLIISS